MSSSPPEDIRFKLRQFLDGTLPEWSAIDNDKETFLSRLLSSPQTPHISHKGLIDVLKGMGPRQVCQYQFRTNDIVWICKECQKDETCVLCNECYLESDHEGHDVYFYHSAAGGCCDCGDPDAWDASGFCNKHGKKHEDPRSYIPAEMQHNSEIMCNEIINGFLNFCEEYCDLKRMVDNIADDELLSIYLYYDEFHSIDDFRRLLLSDIIEIVLDGSPESYSDQHLTKVGWLRLRSNLSGDRARIAVSYFLREKFTVRAFSLSFKRRYDAVLSSLKFLQSISLACDGMCKTICSCLTSSRLSQVINYDMYFDRDLGKLFHDLLLSLMADQSFKMVAAVAYTNSFQKICNDFCSGAGAAGHTMFNLSVQFLNRELFVHEICYHHNYLDQCTSVLNSLIGEINKDAQFLKLQHILKRRYSPIIGDLKVIGTIPDISRLFLTNNICEWMNCLEYTQLLHLQLRLRDAHVQYEDTTWMAAFNLTLAMSSLFDFLCNWFSKSDSNENVSKYSKSSMIEHDVTIVQTSVLQALNYVTDRCIVWQESNCTAELENAENLLVMMNEYEPMNFPESFSFHILMHRFLAHILMEALKHPHLISAVSRVGEELLNRDRSSHATSVMLQFCLKPIQFAQQIKRNMWRRNGSIMYDQVMNYCEPPYCRVFRDLDSLLTQVCVAVLSPKTALWYIFSAFNSLKCVIFPDKFHQSAVDADYLENANALTTDALQLLINLISELPTEPKVRVSERLVPLIRRELIHVLAAGSVTFSKLQETMAVFHDTDKLTSEEVDSIVADVSIRINPSNVNASPSYVLKKELWTEYDPCFSRLSDQMHSKALELRPKCIESQAITPAPFATHIFFEGVREKLLFDDFLIGGIRNLVYIAARNYTSKSVYTRICEKWVLSKSDKFFPKVIQILTLGIYESQQSQNKMSYFRNYCEEVVIDSLDVDAPSLLEALYDIYVANEVATLGNDFHYLGWIIHQAKGSSVECNRLAEKLERKAVGVHNRKADLDALKAKSQQNAMGNIQNAAAQFMAMLDDVSDTDDDDEEEKVVEEEAEHKNELAQDILENSILDAAFGEPDMFDDSDWVNELLGISLGETDQKPKRTKVADNAEDDESGDIQCIICMSSNKDSCLGLIGLCQPSTVLWPKDEVKLHCPSALLPSDSVKLAKPDIEHSNLRVGFCGHRMHETCHMKYFSDSSRKSIYQDNLMLDPSAGYFSCPLCKKLCNCFFPVIVVDEINSSKLPLSNFSADWIAWFEEYASNNMKSGIKSMSSKVTEVLGQRFIRYLQFGIGSVVHSSCIKLDSTDAEDNLKYLELLISCITYTLCCDLIDGGVPGYFLEPVQQMWTELSESGHDELLKFRPYAPGQDELRTIADIMPLIGLFAVSCGFDKLTLNSILQRTAGRLFDPYPINDRDHQPKYWLQNPTAPLLTLPLLDVAVFIISMSNLQYAFTDDSKDENSYDYVDENEEVASNNLESIPVEKIIPWICIAALVQIVILDDEVVADLSSSSVDDANCFSNISPLFDILNNCWSHSSLGCDTKPIFLNSDECNNKKRRVLFKWVSFLRSVIHILIRSDPANKDWISHFETWSFESIHAPTLQERTVIDHMTVLGLHELLLPLSPRRENQEGAFVEEIIESWLTALHHSTVWENDEIKSLLVANMTTADLGIEMDNEDIEQASTVEAHTESNPSSEFRLLMNDDTMDTKKAGQINMFALHERYRYYPRLNLNSLFALPKDYSKLHSAVSALCTYDYPALCVQCGAVLDAGGHGQCLSHSYSCSQGIGMFFTLQDCRIFLSHGPRCAYFVSPYTDKYGEIRQSQRGKPLVLDSNRFEALQKMWLKHSIPSEVYTLRSTALRVIISGYY